MSDVGEYCAVTHFDDPFHNRRRRVNSAGNKDDCDLDSVNEFVENVGYGQKYYVTTSFRETSTTPVSEFSDIAIDFRNNSEFSDSKKVPSEDTETISSEFGSDVKSEIDIDSNIAISVKSAGSSLQPGTVNEFTQLFNDLELFDCVSSIVRTERQKNEDHDTHPPVHQNDFENDGHDLESQSDGEVDEKENLSPIKRTDTAMSNEARFAVMETLNDMKKKKNSGPSVNSEIRNKGVTAQKKLQNNRLKYDRFKKMAETKNLFPKTEERKHKHKGSVNIRNSITRYNSFDSEGETAADDYSSAFSSEINTKYTDGSSSSEDTQIPKKGKLLPSIDTKRKSAKRLNSAATKFYSLEKAKRTNYRIPGIGKFDIVASPDDFRITPPGFDSRYDPQPIIYKEEREPPPADVQQKSILKCKKWLKNVHLSPLSSLQPAHK